MTLRILNVDRNHVAHLRLEHYLRDFDAELRCCTVHAEAVAAIRSFDPHLVVIDGHLLRPGSLEVLAAIRAEPDLTELPIAVVTALGETRRDLRDPFTVVLAKPLTATDLLQLVGYHERRLALTRSIA